MYYDDEENNKDTGIGENPPLPQEPEEPLPDLSEESEQAAPADDFDETQMPQQETIPSAADAAADPYHGMSEKEYKANIKRMKREYKQFQKDKKQSARAERDAMYAAAQPQQYAGSREKRNRRRNFLYPFPAHILYYVYHHFRSARIFPDQRQKFSCQPLFRFREIFVRPNQQSFGK